MDGRGGARAGEWLLTNGLGGYALGPREGGEAFRGYHGWLIAATAPPDGRLLLVSSVETRLLVDGVEHRLGSLELSTGTVDGVTLDAGMPRDVNAAVLTWRVDHRGGNAAALRLAPRLVGRDHHPGRQPSPPTAVSVEQAGRVARVRWGDPDVSLVLAASAGSWERVDRTVDVTYPEEIARGTASGERLAVPLELVVTDPDVVTLVLGTETGGRAPLPDPRAVAAAPPAPVRDHVDALRAAASRFIVRRDDPGRDGPGDGVTIVAGYPWFGDWGRDTFIALPGLTLATGRHDVAERVLRTWAPLVRDGLLPNHFPDRGTPAYHAIDAPLWFIHALGEHERATGHDALARDLWPSVAAIVGGYASGTRFGIGMDADGLVRGGEDGVQLTWMDAKVDGEVITPRRGKPVEIQALWVHANRLAARWAPDAGEAMRCRDRADRAAAAFGDRYWRADLGWLSDVVDGPDGDDPSLRPNQLLALTIAPDLVTTDQALSILHAVERHLVVPGGIRTLAPFEPGYRSRFQGPPAARDAAYHQGAAWTWLLGAWIDAVERWRGADDARVALARALEALDPGRTGAIPELLEPEPPFEARGCPWQAWGTGELLRVATRLVAEP